MPPRAASQEKKKGPSPQRPCVHHPRCPSLARTKIDIGLTLRVDRSIASTSPMDATRTYKTMHPLKDFHLNYCRKSSCLLCSQLARKRSHTSTQSSNFMFSLNYAKDGSFLSRGIQVFGAEFKNSQDGFAAGNRDRFETLKDTPAGYLPREESRS